MRTGIADIDLSISDMQDLLNDVRECVLCINDSSEVTVETGNQALDDCQHGASEH